MQDYEQAAADFAAKLQALAITVECAFVPQSQSRNAGETALSLNWRVAVLKDGKPIRGIETVDYMQGIGHAPSYKSAPKWHGKPAPKWLQEQCQRIEAETGKVARISVYRGEGEASHKPLSPPTVADVLSSLCLDASALDNASFDDWASDYGYDTDSRKAEGIYRQCLATAMALRAAIGEESLAELRNLASEM